MHVHCEGGTMLLYTLMCYPLEFYVMLWNEFERQADDKLRFLQLFRF